MIHGRSVFPIVLLALLCTLAACRVERSAPMFGRGQIVWLQLTNQKAQILRPVGRCDGGSWKYEVRVSDLFTVRDGCFIHHPLVRKDFCGIELSPYPDDRRGDNLFLGECGCVCHGCSSCSEHWGCAEHRC